MISFYSFAYQHSDFATSNVSRRHTWLFATQISRSSTNQMPSTCCLLYSGFYYWRWGKAYFRKSSVNIWVMLDERFGLTVWQIASAPRPRWKQLTHRRLQTWPSDLVNNKLVDAPLPNWLEEPIVTRLKSIPLSQDSGSSNIFSDSPHGRPNHVLINEYPPGIGIMPHKVGDRWWLHDQARSSSRNHRMDLRIIQSYVLWA